MTTIYKRKMQCGAEAIWSVPLAGYGHVADEQPLPYIHHNGIEITPRFGGEEALTEASICSIPLPYGKLKGEWPLKQKLFNLMRKRINIYWRNIFSTFCRADRLFYFLEQLKYSGDVKGFKGVSPSLIFSREFEFAGNTVVVTDKVHFLMDMDFEYLHLSPYASFSESLCDISVNSSINHEKNISSSTGKAIWKSLLQKNVTYNLGDEITWQYQYQIKC